MLEIRVVKYFMKSNKSKYPFYIYQLIIVKKTTKNILKT